MNIPSYRIKEGDEIEVREKSRQLIIVDDAIDNREREIPEYIEVDIENLKAKFIRVPQLKDVPYPTIMEPNLVVEYYAKN